MMVNKNWFSDFVDMIGKFKIKWTCLARSEDITISTADRMKKAGCQEVFLGIETGSSRLLALMHKRATVRQNIGAINVLRMAGIKSCAYMMFGFPGENQESVNETIDFLEVTSPDKSRISQFLPVPGSDVYNNPERYGVKIKFDPDNFWYFDKHNLCVDYGNNEEMVRLRELIMQYYKERGYQDGWA